MARQAHDPEARDLPKRIVLFSDGTGNSSAKLFKTNVWRLYDALDVDPVPEDISALSSDDVKKKDPIRQIAYYDDGVGTSSFKPLAVLGGALGLGLSRNVRDIYAFLCRHHRPGDEIYGFGFSRGAFTMRIVAELIEHQGVIRDYADEADLQQKALWAYRAYRSTYKLDSPLSFVVTGLRRIRDLVLGGARQRQFAARKIDKVKIRLLGLWDTVDAYGLPIDEMTRAMDEYVWPLTMRKPELPRCVERARHVLALDDERHTFHPRLMQERAEDNGEEDIDKRQIAQVWFAGVHSNVGGGYPNDTLSFVSLNWMLDRIDVLKGRGFGLRFFPEKLELLRQSADVLGPIYDSRNGFGGYYRYQPRRFELLVPRPAPSVVKGARDVAQWARDKARGGAKAPSARYSPDRETRMPTQFIHESVFERIRLGTRAGYGPLVIPRDYAVVRSDNGVEVVKPEGGGYETEGQRDARETIRRNILNLVWLRRLAYFSCVAMSAWIVYMPFHYGIEKTSGVDPATGSIISVAPGLAASFLPGFLRPWFEVFAANPERFATFAGIVAFLLYYGARLAGRIEAQTGMMWSHLRTDDPAEKGKRLAEARAKSGFTLKPLNALVSWLTRLAAYQWILLNIKNWLAPVFFALVFYAFAAALTSRLVFNTVVAPRICEGAVGQRASAFADGVARTENFDIRSPCWGSGIQLNGGRRYEVTLEIQPLPREQDTGPGSFAGQSVLFDGSIRLDLFGRSDIQTHLSGWDAFAARAAMIAGLPWRRAIAEPWMTYFAKVGYEGRDDQPLFAKIPPSKNPYGRSTLVSEITARRTGELLLYANDAFGIFAGATFYRNNRGLVTVTVKQLDWNPDYSRH